MKSSLYLKKMKFEDKYFLEEKLGSGTFASVYRCKLKQAEADEPSPQMKPTLPSLGRKNATREIETSACFVRSPRTAAVKVFDKSNTRSMFREESKIWSSMAPHENCVMMLEAFEDDRYFYIVMERCSVSLSDALHWHALNRKDPKEQDIKHTCKGLLSGVNHLHEGGIVHRDVKPANILLAKGYALFGQPLVKLCDMGFAAKVSGSDSLSEVCGTPLYMAPEMLLSKRYDTKVDVWSCGVIAYLMILDVFPYGEGCFDMNEIKRKIRTGKVLPTFKAQNNSKQPSHEAVQFLASLLNRDPEERPSAKRALTLTYLDSSTPPSSKFQSAQSKELKRERRHKSITMEALCLEFSYSLGKKKNPYSIHCDDGSRLRRHSDAKAPTHGVADDVMKAPCNEVHDVVRKVDDELKSRQPSCSTHDDEDGVESVVSDESSTYMSSETEPLADVIPSFKPALSRIRM